MVKISNIWHCIIILGGLSASLSLTGQEVTYHHSVYDISISASSGWFRELSKEPGGTILLTHPNRNMQVRLGYLDNCANPGTYMDRLTGREGMACIHGLFDTTLNTGQAIVARGFVLDHRRSYRCLIVGFPYHNGLYLMEIRCPEDCYPEHIRDVREILASVRVGGRSPY